MYRRQTRRQEGDSIIFDHMDLMGTVGMLKTPEEVESKIQNLLGRLDQLQNGRSPEVPRDQNVTSSQVDNVEVVDGTGSLSFDKNASRRMGDE